MRKKTFNNILIENVAAEGKCIAHIDGKAVFIPNVAPGDIVDLKIVRKKKSFLEAKAIHFHKKSEIRVDPFCEHFALCGGCKWQHLPYEIQLKAKQQQIIDHFQRIGQFEFPEMNGIIGSTQNTRYRNKLEYTFSNKRWVTDEEIASEEELNRNGVGFHLPGFFDKVLDIKECHLQTEPTNEIRNTLREFAISNSLSFYDIREKKGLLRNLIIRTSVTGQVMVIVQFGENDKTAIDLVMEYVHESFPIITSLYFVVNLKQNETMYDQDLRLFSGKPYIEEKLNDLVFRIGPKSFFQTNISQTEKLYECAVSMAEISNKDVVYDLYCGTGSITNFAAQKCQMAIGIETISEAIEDAKINSKINGIENTRFIVGDVKDVLDEKFVGTFPAPDIVITDPPRAGMHKDVIKTLLTLLPRKIVYISCNPATQARDLADLIDTYTIREIQPIDMFPHTHHLENIVLLEKES